MNHPVNIMSLCDLDFFLDERLSEYNVYQVTIVTPYIEEVLTDVFCFMRKYSCNQLLQEMGADYAKLTFVSRVNCCSFYHFLQTSCQQVSALHKVPLFNII